VPIDDPTFVRSTPSKKNPTSSVDYASAEYLLSRKFYPTCLPGEDSKYNGVLKSAAEYREFVKSLSINEIQNPGAIFAIDTFPLLPGRFKNALLRQKLFAH